MGWVAVVMVVVGLFPVQDTATVRASDATVARQEAFHGMTARPSYRPNDPARPTVCLVHGMNSSSGGFVHLIPLLERAGFGVIVYDYPFNRDLDVTAPAFVADWAAFRARTGDRQPWAVVTHSMGGLLARYYVEGPDYDGDVSTLVLIAPPNAGSALARAQPLFQLIEGLQAAGDGGRFMLPADLGAAADDLLPGSPFLKQLNALPRRAGVEYRILAGNVGFLDRATRRQVEARYRALTRAAGLLGGLARLAVADLPAQLDELTDGTGDGAVAVASTRLEGVASHVVIPANHVELIRGPMLYPEPGPVACMPYLLEWLGRPVVTAAPASPRGTRPIPTAAPGGPPTGDF